VALGRDNISLRRLQKIATPIHSIQDTAEAMIYGRRNINADSLTTIQNRTLEKCLDFLPTCLPYCLSHSFSIHILGDVSEVVLRSLLSIQIKASDRF
jgi:hypothetical protein